MVVYGYTRSDQAQARTSLETQRRHLEAFGVSPADIYRDVPVPGRRSSGSLRGWSRLLARLNPGDQVAVDALSIFGPRIQDISRPIAELHSLRVHLLSLQDEAAWLRYVGAAPDTPEHLAGSAVVQVLTDLSQWHDLAITRITGPGKAKGSLGRPRRLSPTQVQALSRERAAGASWSQLGRRWDIPESTIRRALESAPRGDRKQLPPGSQRSGAP